MRVPVKRQIDAQLQLTARAFSDSERRFRLKIVTPHSTRTDSLPAAITLAPHERKEVLIHLRGTLDSGRYEFGAVGTADNGDVVITGMCSTQYPHIPPVFFRGAGVRLQGAGQREPAVQRMTR